MKISTRMARAAALCLALFGLGSGAHAQPGASVSVKVNVPLALQSSPFDSDRFLNVPPGFAVDVWARVPGARFMALAPNGDVLVSVPGAGNVELVRPQASGNPVVSHWVTGLRNPHDIVFHTIGATTYVYVSESNQIDRFIYNSGDLTAHDQQVVVAGLPDASSPELHGAYGHQLKNLALGPDHKLYVEISSTSNADPADTTSNPVRCAVYQYNADGTGGRLFARGLRNPEGLAFVPGTNELWATVNSRDNTAYPFHKDFDGDGSDDYGKVMTAYVDNHVPDEFTKVTDGANYGWPFANPNPDTASGMDNPPFDADVQNNPEGSPYPVGNFTRINKGIQAHSAALGLSFLQNTSVPMAYRSGAVIALHGSWNRSKKTGYKVIYFPWNGSAPGAQVDLVTGWLDPASQGVWGRPVDVVPDSGGNLLISDDMSGTIYKLRPTSATASASAWSCIDIASGPDNTTRALWTNPDGRAQIWTVKADGSGAQSSTTYGSYPGWTARALRVGSDGKMRALWTNADGRANLWVIGSDDTLDSIQEFGPLAGWTAKTIGVGSDGKFRMWWTNTDGRTGLWRVGTGTSIEVNDTYSAPSDWTAKMMATGADGKFRMLWTNRDGRVVFWTLSADRQLEQNATWSAGPNWSPVTIAVGDDGKTRALWNNTDGHAAVWIIGVGGNLEFNSVYGPYTGWTAKSIAVGGDGQTRMLWTQPDGHAAFWKVAPDTSYSYGIAEPLPN